MDRALEEASGFIELGMFRHASAVLDKLSPEQRAEPKVLAERVRIYLARGKIEEAKLIAQSLTSNAPASAYGWYSLARVALREGCRNEAKANLREVFKRQPDLRQLALDDADVESIWD